MSDLVELVIVGGGPAGLAAAVEASDLGLPVVLVDAFARLGGQYFKQTAPDLEPMPNLDHQGRVLLERVVHDGTQVLPNTVVWGIFVEPDREDEGFLLRLYGPSGTPRSLRAKKVILAAGAYDRPMPFPGWTLPGVMTAGAALTMVKHERVLPGRRVLLSGTGPLQLVLARHLIDAGVDVVAVLDANGFPWRGWRYAGRVWGQWERLQEGWEAWWTMRRAGTPIRWGHAVARAEGRGRVESAQIRPLRGAGSGVENVSVDTVCLGYGFSPAVQLSRQAGCEHVYRPGEGGHIPSRDAWLQTTREGLFAAGDSASIGGKDVAILEGRLAALGAARQLGLDVSSERVSRVKRRLTRQRRFVAVLDDLFPFPSHLQDLLSDDTIVCRCEEVTVGEIRQAIAKGATTVSAVRMLTRAGMGRCQKRMCGHTVAGLLARELDQPLEMVDHVTPRPPVIPVPLEGMEEGH
jgi:NADPH-dependent 2,4-dienoyl-CoA reductase/sulfur reductase-like enzyme